MSLIGAFIAGVTGIDAQTQKLGAVSDNIANANTVGYKPTFVNFESLVIPTGAPTTEDSTGPVPFNFAPGGVTPSPQMQMYQQGLLTSTQSSTDLAISGRGFFAVTPTQDISGSGTSATLAQGSELALTRAGSFTLNANGLLVNSAGFALLGTPVGSTLPTSLTGLQPVALDPGPTVEIGGTATTSISISANLPAGTTVGTTEQQTIGVFDSSGTEYSLGITYTNTGTNTWTAAATSLTPTNSTSGITATVSSTPVTLSFDSNGQLTSPATGLSLGSFSLSNGATLSPTVSFPAGAETGLTQFGSSFASSNVQADGGASAFRTGIQVTSDGTVDEVYSNGTVIPKFQVPVVTVINPDALEAQTGNVYLPTLASGTPAISLTNTGGAGQIMPSELEQSSVDLATEFQNMIISEATYQANTKTITTANQMYETIAELR
jgi:flagellar hook protein FlgE